MLLTVITLISLGFLHGQFIIDNDPYSPETTANDRCSCVCNNLDSIYSQDSNCNWKMIFKGVAGNGRSVYDDYVSGGSINDGYDAPGILSDLPYRNSLILDNWSRYYIPQVRIELFDRGVRTVKLVFDSKGSDYKNWFENDRLIKSPYTTLSTIPLRFFSMEGSPDAGRRFYISHLFGDCADDCGFLVVVDPLDDKPCGWEEQTATPYFLYGTSPTNCTSYDDTEEIGLADRFIISARLCDI